MNKQRKSKVDGWVVVLEVVVLICTIGAICLIVQDINARNFRKAIYKEGHAVVIEKDVESGEKERYSLTLENEKGERGKIRVTPNEYDYYRVGDIWTPDGYSEWLHNIGAAVKGNT